MDRKRYPFQKSWRWRLVRVIDFWLDRLGHRSRPVSPPKNVHHILVVRLDHIGDIICSLPALPLLRKRFPGATITMLTGEIGTALLKDHPDVDHLLLFKRNWFSRNGRMDWSEWLRLVLALRKGTFDIGFDLRGDLRNILLMWLGGVRYRIGYEIGGGGGLLHQVGEYDLSLHQAELNVKLVTGHLIPKEQLKPQIHIGSEETAWASRYLDQVGCSKTDRLIAVHPEAGYPAKEWETARIKDLIDRLLLQPENRIIIFGLSQAHQIAQVFAHDHWVIDTVGTLSLRQMTALMKACNLFIGNDSGPSHLAQALDIPSLIIASGTNEYEKWGVWAQTARVLKHAVPCAPCHLRFCNVSGHPCMSEISAEEAYQAVQEIGL